jgi:dCTP deaminase
MSNAAHAAGLFPEMRKSGTRHPGVLPAQEIRELINNGKLLSPVEIPDSHIQPASVDLRLGNVAYRVQASFLPSRTSTIDARVRELQIAKIDLSKPAVLQRGAVFIVPLIESLALPVDMRGKANPKSTTGRLDVFVRLMTNACPEFEEVPVGYHGDLYVEIVARTFPVVVQAGTKLNQLRFFRGNPERDDSSLRMLARRTQLVYHDNGTAPSASEEPAEDAGSAVIDRGLRLTVDLQGNKRNAIVAYRAKKQGHCAAIDLSKVAAYGPADYWDAIPAPPAGRFVLEPSDFYLLASRERICVPPDYAAEMEQYDPSLGEFSVHYAGFFDPAFGYGAHGEIKGTKAVLEVRAHEVPILLEHEQTVGRLTYLKMAATPDKVYGQAIGSSYQQQGLALSKQFRNPLPVAVPPMRA